VPVWWGAGGADGSSLEWHTLQEPWGHGHSPVRVSRLPAPITGDFQNKPGPACSGRVPMPLCPVQYLGACTLHISISVSTALCGLRTVTQPLIYDSPRLLSLQGVT
jgi:hypothetical protein